MEKLEIYNSDHIEMTLKQQILSLINEGYTTKHIADEIGKSVSSLNRFMKKYSIYHFNLPRYNYKITRFEIVDELSAYIAGLYWSDGHLSQSSLSITFWIEDEILIMEIINKYFFGDFHAYKYSSNRKFITLKIFNKKIRDDFSNLGLVNNDAGRTVPNIPNLLFRHFLRGMIDGDGHNNQKYKKCQLAGRLLLLNNVGRKLDKLGLISSFDIHESPKSKKTRIINKYGVLNFKRYFLFRVFKFLYKNSSFLLQRKFQELNQIFSESGSEIDFLRRKYSANYVRENRKVFKRQHRRIIRYAFPRLYPKNPDVLRELEVELPTIREKIIDCKWDISRLRKHLNKKGVEVSDSSLRRFIDSNGIMPNSIKERSRIEENKTHIIDAIYSGENRRSISKRLSVQYRRLRRSSKGIKSDSHIEMVNPDYFEKIETEQKAFFTGFLILRNSINDKYLSLKCKDEKYAAIIVHLAHTLYGEIIPNKIKAGGSLKYSFGSKKLISSLRKLSLHEKSSTVINFISTDLWHPFILGMFYSGMKVQKIKTGFCSRISGNPDVMKWLQNFLNINGIYVRFESNNNRRLVLLHHDYDRVIQIFGDDLHLFLTRNIYTPRISFR